MAKPSKRDRYIEKYNGPDAVNNSRLRRQYRAEMGKGNEDSRVWATAHTLRYRGPKHWPSSADELFRRAGFAKALP